MGVPARHKKLWLAEQIRTSLTRFSSDVDDLYGTTSSEPKIELELGSWRFEWFRNRATREEIMGDPIWYAEILFTGPTTTLKETVDRTWIGGIHEYQVSLFLEYKSPGSTTLFEDMTDSEEIEKIGLMIFLKNSGVTRITWPDSTQTYPSVSPTSQGDVIASIRETGDENTYRDLRSVVSFDKSNPELSEKAHLLEFRVNIADIL